MCCRSNRDGPTPLSDEGQPQPRPRRSGGVRRLTRQGDGFPRHADTWSSVPGPHGAPGTSREPHLEPGSLPSLRVAPLALTRARQPCLVDQRAAAEEEERGGGDCASVASHVRLVTPV